MAGAGSALDAAAAGHPEEEDESFEDLVPLGAAAKEQRSMLAGNHLVEQFLQMR